MVRNALLGLALVAGLPTVCAAQDKNEVRNAAKQQAAALRALGEPMDRCSLGANIAEGGIVSRTFAVTTLKPGDKLLLLNGTSLTGKSPDNVIAMLRQLPATATVALKVERDGAPTDLSVACANSRANYEPFLAALDLAARGKFEECVSAVAPVASADTSASVLKLTCTSVQRNASPADVGALAAQTADMAIEDARYVPTARPMVVQQLRNMEGIITQGVGAVRYQQLVDATRKWPGGETAYSASAPDWALFRRNSEAALRAHLIDPDSAHIEWPHGFTRGTWKPFLSKPIEGYWSCGLINARNRMGGYVGAAAFVVVLDPEGTVKYSEMGQGARDFDILAGSCAKSVRLLPPAPPELRAETAAAPGAGGNSLADELKKLVELKNAGALTEQEFQAAKAKLLGGSSP